MAINKSADILQAALHLFSNRGFDGTTVPMIAEEAHVGAGTIYRYFESKEALVNVLYQQCIRQFKEKLQRNLPQQSEDFRDQFHYIFYEVTKFAHENIHALIFIDSHTNGYYLDERSKRLYEEFMDFLRNLLDRGKQQGIVCQLPSEALIAIIYGAIFRLYKSIRIGVIEETEELLAEVEECCWRAIAAI